MHNQLWRKDKGGTIRNLLDIALSLLSEEDVSRTRDLALLYGDMQRVRELDLLLQEMRRADNALYFIQGKLEDEAPEM